MAFVVYGNKIHYESAITLCWSATPFPDRYALVSDLPHISSLLLIHGVVN